MKNLLTATQPILALQIPLFWVTVLVLPVFGAQAGVVFTNLYSFTGTNDGAGSGGLVQGSDGNFYGTTPDGGKYGSRYGGYGSVFKMSTDGALTSLYSFGLVQDTQGVPLDGANPNAGLVQGGDGYFYGTTEGGGTIDNYGTVFKISPNGALTSLYSFTRRDGAFPRAGLVRGSDGCFYGTTEIGGTNDNGTVFKISPNGALTSLHSFTGGNDGSRPLTGLVQGNDGNFYGTTLFSGTDDWGTVFRISTNGALTTIFSCSNGSGIYPSGLVQASNGYFYGTFRANGQTNWHTTGAGKVFKISTGGTLTTLHSFGTITNADGVALDGASPNGLVQGSDGSFYGTTLFGGTNAFGTVFRISTNGTLTTLYSFGTVTDAAGQPLDGAEPNGLVQGRDGSFYGTTAVGTVFRLIIVPEFQALTLANSTLSLTWSTEVGGRYQLQYKSDLSSSHWTNLYSAVTGTGATLRATDSVTNDPRRFYRMVLLP